MNLTSFTSKLFSTKYSLFLFIALFSYFPVVFAQISPPGLGSTATASWIAFGIKQNLNAENTKSSTTYLGFGRISDPHLGSNPARHPAIMVLNQEFYHQFADRWQYSYALSYRRQNQYQESDAHFVPDSIPIQQEFRLYGRMAYTHPLGKSKWTNTFRQEVRKYFDPDFGAVEENIQFRTRAKTQLTIPLDVDGNQKIVGGAEALFAISEENVPGHEWSPFAYKESRFTCYYSFQPSKSPLTLDIGYMNNLIGHGHHTKDVQYIALDVIWNNPFTHH
ncbi:DUF2490 domain-containing protein [Parapedobacter koreensis]|uniref:DUF2490 domain-containing protein n=1 Tax=Parapedobacter koreensis TaxID=332977 RepID=A0A1H7JTJ6_9SPHI|nr:DUF2490 domain-containing protein [Parapedobacter koreensis]SEK77909.1 Protein of unknown function [Parapedobacter koreensis]